MKIKLFYIIIICTISITQTLLSQSQNIKITYERNSDNTVDLRYTKEQPGSYYIKIEFPILENCFQSDYEGVIKNFSGKILTLKPENENQSISFSYKSSSIMGNPKPRIDKSFNYVLPFKKGKSIKVFETTSLKEKYFDAKKNPNWKSFIADRKTPDTICSMRKGIVIKIVDKFATDYSDAYKYTSKMNKILIEHEDGSISSYTGFNKNLIFVELGDTVYPQTELGILDVFNNAVYRLYFDVIYLNEEKLDWNNKPNLNSENYFEHINPYFYSSNGPINLKGNNDYVVEISEDIFLKEFTKKEKKNYKKNSK